MRGILEPLIFFNPFFYLFLFFPFAQNKAHNREQELQTCTQSRESKMRKWDKLLTWTLQSKNRPYLLKMPLVEKTFSVALESLEQFEKKYGFYSSSTPLVGVVTEDPDHIPLVHELLQSLVQIKDPFLKEFARDEILSKILAYRNLSKGMKVDCCGEIYVIDERIDLWMGMPAFGLVPESSEGGPPILLFRGTDMNLISKKGWASILSDLDSTGPGHATFLRAKPMLHDWLQKVALQYQPARVLGYSLGGAFVIYTFLYEPDLIHLQTPSVAFNPPGISKQLYERAKASVTLGDSLPLQIYLNQGDIVSQVGFFLSDVWAVELERKMDILEAHLAFISGQTNFSLFQVDVDQENQLRY